MPVPKNARQNALQPRDSLFLSDRRGSLKKIATEKAVGHVLCHDMTRIVRGEIKEVAFRKGHVVVEKDIPLLLSMGKDYLYIWECDENSMHENDAAACLAYICMNKYIAATSVKEGKIELIAQENGLFTVAKDRLDAINALGDIIIATRHSGIPVKKGDKLAGVRAIPLVLDKNKIAEAKVVAGGEPLLEISPYRSLKAGIVTTGNEVYHGRIQDTFTPVLQEKLLAYGIETTAHTMSDDNMMNIAAAINRMIDEGVDFILCTGGMSVDPDDVTPGAIKSVATEVVTYGAPVLPGAMFLMAYIGNIPVIGLPGCVMYERITIFDLILPRIAAGKKITKDMIAKLGCGGLCLACEHCVFPACGFGKGVW